MSSLEIPQPEQQEQPEIKVETFEGGNVPEEVQNEVQEFIVEQRDATEDSMDRLSAAANHALYLLRSINRAQEEGKTTYLFVAREQEKMVGAGSLVIDPNEEILKKVDLLYVGRAFDEPKKGIGSKILLAEHEILKNHGIRFYSTRVHDGSMGLYKRLGIKFQVTPGSEKADTCEIVARVD